jgi:hypothetical protein
MYIKTEQYICAKAFIFKVFLLILKLLTIHLL